MSPSMHIANCPFCQAMALIRPEHVLPELSPMACLFCRRTFLFAAGRVSPESLLIYKPGKDD